MRVFNMDQGTPEWQKIRAGVSTASMADAVYDRKKDGSLTAAGSTLVYRLALERIVQVPIDPVYVNTAMQHGKDNEDNAADALEARTGVFLDRVGFVMHDTLQAGCSPDRLIQGSNGGVEIKCPFSQAKVAEVWATGDVSEWTRQVEFQMWICGWDFAQLVIYDPRLEFCGMDLYVTRIERDEARMKLMGERIAEFCALVDQAEKSMREKAELMVA